jgi:F-type H+-transporting ATPase subunit gamma
MSTLAQHQRHLGALRDIRDIMAALKNISLTESLRLRRFLASQQRVMDGIGSAMGDFLGHYPQSLPGGDAAVDIILLIGSERGFCGDFNEALLEHVKTAASKQQCLVAVGEKLGGKLDEMQIRAESLAGLTTVEDVPDVLLAVVEKLRELSARHGAMQLTIVYHHFDGGTLEVRRRQPFRRLAPAATRRGYPPLLNVAPQTFFPQLLDHYLFAVLHSVLYSSLAAEHQLRLQHLQGAIEHIDKQCTALTQRYNNLRQELITEEIELIVLSAGAYAQE